MPELQLASSHAALAALVVLSDWAIRLGMLVVVPNRRSPEAAKGWLIFVMVLPWIGLLVYLVIGRPSLPKWRLDRFERFPTALAPIRTRLQALPAPALPQIPATFEPSVRLATSLGTMPILGGNEVELLGDYDATLARIAADIDAARHSVHLCFYIFGDDHATAPVIRSLGSAVARGVACRVLIDGFGSKHSLKRILPRLAAVGVDARVALPVKFGRKAARFDLRNHRKIVVVDGRIGYTGSQNMVAADFKPGLHYTELMVRMTGPMVLQLQALFASDWYVESGQLLDEDAFPEPARSGTCAGQILPSGPQSPGQKAHRLLVNLVYAARDRIVITTPYFIPDGALLQALETAVQRGAEVHLIVDSQVDQFLVGHAQRSYYEELLQAGVRIHAYAGGFLHTKSVCVDDAVAWIGSCNMDIRSFALNEEVVALFYHAAVTAELQRVHAGYMDASEEIELEAWRARPFSHKFVDNMTRLVSPLL